MEGEPFSSRIFNWILTRFPPVTLIAGLLLLYIYNDTQLPWALAMCKLSFGVFLLMPGWLLLFSPDTAIALINAVGLFFGRKSPEGLPPKPVIEKRSWSQLGSFVKALIILVSLFSFGYGSVLTYQGFTNIRVLRRQLQWKPPTVRF